MKTLLQFAMLVVLLSAEAEETRPPFSDASLRGWLENMVWHHRFSHDEICAATGLKREQVERALQRFNITSVNKPSRKAGAPLLVLPYPGGRHPRIGFLEGAIDPQRETKLSIFTPWDETSYVVADIPEAIWSNLGLTYLAHTHIPTIWSKVQLPKLEWQTLADGSYKMERTLPNGIAFGTAARPTVDALYVKMWLSNGTSQVLRDLRVQNCVMLKGASEFTQQTNSNKVMRGSFAASHDASGKRWIITGFKPLHRAWANAPVPCLHSDPKFPDTAPGEVSKIRGLITFFSGTDIEAELQRLEAAWSSGD